MLKVLENIRLVTNSLNILEKAGSQDILYKYTSKVTLKLELNFNFKSTFLISCDCVPD